MKLVVDFYRRLSTLQRSLLGAWFGFVLYGGWALLVNMMHGEDSAMRAALVQGSYSFILTFFMTLLLESIFHCVKKTFDVSVVSVLITVTLACSLVFSGSWYVNYLSGTPEIFKTVILGYVLGGLYAIAYTIGLAKESVKV